MFITFEGPDGSGKTSQLPLLANTLRVAGYHILATREPGGTLIGDQVRAILSNLENKSMHPRTEILLFQASRAQHVEEAIRPFLQAGGTVICDRYADSTIAYQGYGHQVDLGELHQIVNYATGGLQPDLTLLFDLDVEVGLRRRAAGGEWNRLDDYELAFHRRVRAGYHILSAAEPERWVTIEADQPPGRVQEAVAAVVLPRLAAFLTARVGSGD